MLDIHNPQGLFETVRDLRSDILAKAEVLFQEFRSGIERRGFDESARNLACYLALRSHDLRSLQLELQRWALSSLGRSESRVQPSLDATLKTLGTLAGVDASALPSYPSEEAVFRGSQIIEREADALFGRVSGERSTRIMVTLGTEAAEDPALIKALLEAGVECVRINCAHDDSDVWQGMIDNVRAAEQTLGRTEPVRVLMDLGGPKIRTVRPKKQEKDVYRAGDKLLLTALDVEDVCERAKHEKRKERLPVVGCTLPVAIECLNAGDRVYIDDGLIGARVLERISRGIVVEIIQVRLKGRKIRSGKGLNVPDTELDVPCLTEKDLSDLDFVAQHADLVGYSFVQTPADITALLGELAKRVPSDRSPPALVLKIETQKAVRNLPSLIVEAAGKLPTAVMIARGDLAIALGFARIAEIQEEVLWLCEAAHVPVIWATQVLEGLAKESLPTRAEVTDAAMAGRAECVMLNKGPYITEAVKMLATVLVRMQGHQHKRTPQLRVLHSWEGLFSREGSAGESAEPEHRNGAARERPPELRPSAN